jgi:hypothetical protein
VVSTHPSANTPAAATAAAPTSPALLASTPPAAALAAALAAAAAPAPAPPGPSTSSREVCGPLSTTLLAAHAVNNTIMLLLSDYSTTPWFFHHWLGNVQAANISYWVVAAADTATSQHMINLGFKDRCYTLRGTEGREQSAGGGEGRGGGRACVVWQAADIGPQYTISSFRYWGLIWPKCNTESQ